MHNRGVLVVEVSFFTGVGFEIVELPRRIGRGVGEDERLESGITLVAIAAGAGVRDQLP